MQAKKFYHEAHEGHEGEFEKTIDPTITLFDGSSGFSLGGPRMTTIVTTLLVFGRLRRHPPHPNLLPGGEKE
jgi:hypothetical protein